MSDRVWLIPVQSTPTQLRMTIGVLERHGIAHALINPESVRDRLNHVVPRAAMVHGGALSPSLIDVQRWLAEFRVPTMVLVRALTDQTEATLLSRGASDVLAVPVSSRKLGSRVEAMVRAAGSRTRPRLPVMVSVQDGFDIFPRQRLVEIDGELVDLTKSEFDILLWLALRRGDVLTRDELAEILGHEHVSDRALESHVSRVRIKLRDAGAPDMIDTVRAVGYRLHTPR